MTQSKKNTLNLIILDMRVCNLVNLLDNIHIEAYDYLPRISEPVFELAGVPDEKQTAGFKEGYYVLIQENAEAVNVLCEEEIERRAEDIWQWIRMNR